MRPAVLLELARRNGVDLPRRTSRAQEWFPLPRLRALFVQIYLTARKHCGVPRTSSSWRKTSWPSSVPEHPLQRGPFHHRHPLGTRRQRRRILHDLEEAVREAEASYGRHPAPDPRRRAQRGPKVADTTREWPWWPRAGRRRPRLTAAIALPNEPFREHFETARKEGLHRVAHTRRTSGPSRSLGARVCGAERIGHGVRAGRIRRSRGAARPGCARSRSAQLERCLGVTPDLASLRSTASNRAGCRVSVSSDDPAFFHTNSPCEYLLHQTFGYSAADGRPLPLPLRQSFLPDGERAGIEQRFRDQFDVLAGTSSARSSSRSAG